MGEVRKMIQLRTTKIARQTTARGSYGFVDQATTKYRKYFLKQKAHIKHIGEFNMNYIYRYIDTEDNIIK